MDSTRNNHSIEEGAHPSDAQDLIDWQDELWEEILLDGSGLVVNVPKTVTDYKTSVERFFRKSTNDLLDELKASSN